jgi:hypothetical protein
MEEYCRNMRRVGVKNPWSASLILVGLLVGGCVPLHSDYAVFQKSTVLAIDRRALKALHVDLPPSGTSPSATAVYLKTLSAARRGTKAALATALPALVESQWVRPSPPSGEGLVDDPVDLLAAVLVHDLNGAGLASAQSASCLGLSTCPSAQLVLGVRVNDVHLSLLPDTAALKLIAFEAEATLSTRDGREVWRGTCMVENLTDTAAAVQANAPRLQALFDRSTLKCAQLLGAALRAALQSAPEETP